MKKDEIYKYGKILCCAAAGLAVLAVVLNKKTISFLRKTESTVSRYTVLF